jgi:glycosyltransferase involved in cell wall biosynthesis
VAFVTIGLPFHNARDFIAGAIRSVFAQTFHDWELLLVDDGSTDGSLEIASRVRDSRVRLIADGKHRMLPARLNHIADAARGDLIARLDADDMMHPERLARQVGLLSQQPDVDFVGTACFTMNARGEVVGVIASEAVRTDPYHVLRRGLLAHATLLCRREWCRGNRYDERFPRAEDRELFCRTLREARFAHIREPLYFVRYGKEKRTALRDYIETSRDNRRIFAEHARRLAGPGTVVPLVLESLAREGIFRIMTAAGQQSALFRRRGHPLSSDQLDDAQVALRHIGATAVPGL